MWFFTALSKSCFDVRWLKSQRQNPGRAWGYFFLFVLAAAALTLLPLFIRLPRASEKLQEKLQTQAPEFTATFKKGKLAVADLPQPYIRRAEGFVLVVDTRAGNTATLEAFLIASDAGGMLVAANEIEFFDRQRNQRQVKSWKDMPDYSLTKATVERWLQQFLSPGYLILFGAIALVLVIIGLTVSKLFSILLVTFITLIVCATTKRNWKFTELFAIGLFAITLPTLLTAVIRLFGLYVPFMHFFALLAFMLAVVLTKDGEEQPAVEPKP